MTVITVEALLSHTVEEGDCLLWKGSMSPGVPRIKIDGAMYSVRRLVYEALVGEIPEGMQIGAKCRNERCVHPDCIIARTRKQAMKGARFKANHTANVAHARRAQAKLDDEKVLQIREAEGRHCDIAAQFGISKSYVSQIRSHRSWRDFSNPFSGLMR